MLGIGWTTASLKLTSGVSVFAHVWEQMLETLCVSCQVEVSICIAYVRLFHYSCRRKSREYWVRRLAASVCDSVCLSVCPHDKTKTAETNIAKLGTGIVRHDTASPVINVRQKGQRSRSHGHKVQNGDRVAAVSYVLYRVPVYNIVYIVFQIRRTLRIFMLYIYSKRK